MGKSSEWAWWLVIYSSYWWCSHLSDGESSMEMRCLTSARGALPAGPPASFSRKQGSWGFSPLPSLRSWREGRVAGLFSGWDCLEADWTSLVAWATPGAPPAGRVAAQVSWSLTREPGRVVFEEMPPSFTEKVNVLFSSVCRKSQW